MNTPTQEKRQTIVFKLSLISAIVALCVVFAIIALEIYVRWTINKDFLFLGGFELEALTISAFALVLGIAYLYRPVSN